MLADRKAAFPAACVCGFQPGGSGRDMQVQELCSDPGAGRCYRGTLMGMGMAMS